MKSENKGTMTNIRKQHDCCKCDASKLVFFMAEELMSESVHVP